MTDWLRVRVNILLLIVFCLSASVETNELLAQAIVPAGVSGHTVTIEDSWCVSGVGYKPVRVTIENNPPVTLAESQKFTISLWKQFYRRPSNMTFAEVVIPAGQLSGTVEMYLSLSEWQALRGGVEMLVERGEFEGRLDPQDLCQVKLVAGNIDYLNLPSVLLVSNKGSKAVSSRKVVCFGNTANDAGNRHVLSTNVLPSFDKMYSMYDSDLNGIPMTKVTPTMVAIQHPRIHVTHAGNLPEKWIGLTSVDQLMISLADFESICKTKPTQRSNIERWVAAGGMLLVFDAGSHFQNAAADDLLLQLMLGPERSAWENRKPTEWNKPGKSLLNSKKLIPVSRGRYYMRNKQWYSDDEDYSQMNGDWAAFSGLNQFPKDTKFAFSNYLDGQIFVVSDDMTKWTSQDWRTLQNTVTVSGRSMSLQLGSISELSLDGFEIPEVGEPPIKMFQILIGTFLILVGPVALIVLRRTENMQFLFVAVPLLSVIFCISLFLYAILIDGSKKWGRVQTYTNLNHQTNMAVTHARAAYYSGTAPGAYEFSSDTVAFAPTDRDQQSKFHQFNQDTHSISGGSIRPRTPHQVVSISSKPALQRLVQVNSDSGKVVVQNRLEGEVEMAIIRKGDKFFIIENLAINETAEATPILADEANSRVAGFVNKNSPKIIRNSRTLNYNGEDDFGQLHYQFVRMSRNNMINSLKPDSYIALLKKFPLTAKQTETVEYKMELHIVRGQW